MLVFQGGFLEDPSKPGTSGQRDLQYDIENGTFKLKTLSFARINCDMDFIVYPFDIQTCQFVILPSKNSSYQAQNYSVFMN